MATSFENRNLKGKKPIAVGNAVQVKISHELASGKCTGPRGAANSEKGRESKALRHNRKK